MSATTRVPGSSADSSRVAAIPSMTGIDRSISTTSGAAAAAISRACWPVRGLAGRLNVGGGFKEGDQAGPDEVVVVDDEDADHPAAAS